MEAEPATDPSARYCPVCETLTAERECPRDGMPTVPGTQFHEVGDGAPGRILNGRYRLGPRLAEGGMGRVYRGHQLAMDRPVAIKLLRPELVRDKRAVQRFYREARAASQLTGRHFVRVHDFGFDEDAGTPFLAMELLDGPTLADLGAIHPRRAAALLAQVAEALVEAERHHIVHRDLKAANILLSVDAAGRELVKVTDFGVAKRLDDGDTGLTRTGAPVGTPSCMAPEQIRGLPVDVRTDLYALGCLLHRLLTGARVFEAEQLDVLMHQHLAEVPSPLPAVLPSGEPAPPALAKLRDALLAKRPAERPGDPARVRDLLEAIANGAADADVATVFAEPAAALAAEATTGADLELDTWHGASQAGPPQDAAEPEAAPVEVRGVAPADEPPSRSRGWRGRAAVAAAAGVGLVAAIVAFATPTAVPTVVTTLPPAAAPSRPEGPRPVAAAGAEDRARTEVSAPAARAAVVRAPSAAAPASVPPAATPATAGRAPIAVTIDSEPTAFLYRDGASLGRTPHTLELAPGFAPFDVELRGKGYARKRLRLGPDGPRTHRVTLERLPDEAPSAAPPEDPDRRPRLHL